MKLLAPGHLDKLPVVIDKGQVFRPDDENGQPIPGIAKVQFYINHRGEVCLPKILSSTHEEVARAAIGTVSDMKISPPLADGKPAVTIIKMPFSVK